MRRDHDRILGIYTLAIALIFLAGFMLLVVFGARSFLAVSHSRQNGMNGRMLFSYIETLVRSSDSEDCLEIRETSFGDAIVITDPTGYEFRIFHTDGAVYEQYCSPSIEMSTEDAQRIAFTGTFEPDLSEDGLLTVLTDSGRILVKLRSTQEAADGN